MQQRDTLFINGQWVAPQGKGLGAAGARALIIDEEIPG